MEKIKYTFKKEVDHPSHYNSGKIETMKLIEQSMSDDEYKGFLKGNIIKYLHRYENKGGIQDLEKMIHYINWLIEFHQGDENAEG